MKSRYRMQRNLEHAMREARKACKRHLVAVSEFNTAVEWHAPAEQLAEIRELEAMWRREVLRSNHDVVELLNLYAREWPEYADIDWMQGGECRHE